MSKASRLDWQVLLSHASPDGLHRCVSVPWGGRRVHLCTRCVGLYPAMALAIFARLRGLELPATADEVLRLAVPLIGAAGWTLEQGEIDLGRPARLLSGVLLGLGLGWVIGDHLVHPWPRALWELTAGLGVAFVLGAALRATGLPRHVELPPGRDVVGIAEGKKPDDGPKNEVDPESS